MHDFLTLLVVVGSPIRDSPIVIVQDSGRIFCTSTVISNITPATGRVDGGWLEAVSGHTHTRRDLSALSGPGRRQGESGNRSLRQRRNFQRGLRIGQEPGPGSPRLAEIIPADSSHSRSLSHDRLWFEQDDRAECTDGVPGVPRKPHFRRGAPSTGSAGAGPNRLRKRG